MSGAGTTCLFGFFRLRAPWCALTLGFIERDQALPLTEITGAHWPP